MSIKKWFAIGALASLPFSASAQQAPVQPNPQDANAAVPAFTYESAFTAYRSAAAGEQVSPDKAWRAANDEMGRLGGHAGHMKSSSQDYQAPASAADHSAPRQSGAMDHHKHH